MSDQQSQSTTKLHIKQQPQNYQQPQSQNLNIEEIEKILDAINLEETQTNNHPHQQLPQNNSSNQPNNSVNHSDEEQLSEKVDEIDARDVEVSRSEIIFGSSPLFPGAIQEIDFSINLNFPQNTSNEQNEIVEGSHILRIMAICKNEEFQNLDEYVFSVRSNNYYEYYEQVRFKIKRGERADVKIAVKIPPVQSNYNINGLLQVQLGNLQPISIPMIVNSVVPQIICLKTLYKEDQETNLIRVPAKKGQQRTPPLPFKNLSPFPLSFQIDTVSYENYKEKPYDIITQNYSSCQANSQFFINMQLKQNFNYVGTVPSRMTIRKVLILRIKNSSSYFHFPLEVSVFESQGLEGN